ncbi:MAG: phosphotransferase [Candidatus Thorarchaeota archaeon]
MNIEDGLIRKVMEQFRIGQMHGQVKRLESGFQSDNYQVRTSTGDYVIRIIHDSTENVEYSMRVYEYLADHGIKTPRPSRTRVGKFSLSFNDKCVVVQSFLPGADIWEPLEKVDPLLPFYGKELGRIHQVSVQMLTELGEEKLAGRRRTISYVFEASKKYLPENEYVRQQYDIWAQEIKTIPKDQLTRGVIHGDVGPKDFFFEDGEYTGVLDFNAACLDYLLFDIASMMMYCELIQPDRKEKYITFMTSYLRASPVRKDELNWLHLILRTRWLVQILYHQYRYIEGITQGLDTDLAEGNLKGVVDGENRLRVMNKYSKDYFFRIVGE